MVKLSKKHDYELKMYLIIEIIKKYPIVKKKINGHNLFYLGNYHKIHYEFLNAIERWILSQANENDHETDEVFSDRIRLLNAPFNKKFIEEMIGLKFDLDSVHDFIRDITDKVSNYKELPIPPNINDAFFLSHISRERKNIFKHLLIPIDNVILSCIRYDRIMRRGQQWNLPEAVHRTVIEKFKGYIEGFASPFNSQYLRIIYHNYVNGVNDNYSDKLKICTLFPDVDKPFKSVGSFFKINFNKQFPHNYTINSNPPSVEPLLNKMCTHIINHCDEAKEMNKPIRFIINCNNWTDADFYINYLSSPYLLYHRILHKKTYFYEQSENNDHRMIANFDSVIFVIGYDPGDFFNEDYNHIYNAFMADSIITIT